MRAGGGAAVLPGQGRNVDDATEAALGEVRAEHLAGDKGAAQVDRHRLVELFRRDVHQRRDFRHTGVVHQNVGAAPALGEHIAGTLKVGLAAHIQFNGHGAGAAAIELQSQLLHAVEAYIRQGDAITCRVQTAGDALAQSARGTRYEGYSTHDVALTKGSRARSGCRWS
ncbi:hypothetical protein D3C72_956150 [compost metagenome]